MSNKSKIDKLWNQFRESINLAYADAENENSDDKRCLRDYAENISWSDSLNALLAREIENERQHRRNRPAVSGFSAETAAKLILMQQAKDGATALKIPNATSFLIFRQSAVESQVIGFIIKKYLTAEWRAELVELDYPKLMQPEKAVSA
jgi:hypothetical protein